MSPLPPLVREIQWFVAASAGAAEVSNLDRFDLWNKCRLTVLVVESLSKNVGSMGLTEEVVEVSVRNGLSRKNLATFVH